MKFYEKAYGQRTTNAVAEIIGKFVRKWQTFESADIKMLDVGCGTMDISNQIAQSIKKHNPQIKKISLTGWDVSETAIKAAQEKGYNANICDITQPVKTIDEQYEIICITEVLEHIADTDQALKNIYSLLKNNGLLFVSVPNLAAWYNRIFLLVGMQPHCVELSYERSRLGNWFTKCVLGDSTEIVAGHLRPFSWRGLRDFLRYHRFIVLGVKGISNHKYDFLSKIIAVCFPTLTGNICVVAKKQATGKE